MTDLDYMQLSEKHQETNLTALCLLVALNHGCSQGEYGYFHRDNLKSKVIGPLMFSWRQSVGDAAIAADVDHLLEILEIDTNVRKWVRYTILKYVVMELKPTLKDPCSLLMIFFTETYTGAEELMELMSIYYMDDQTISKIIEYSFAKSEANLKQLNTSTDCLFVPYLFVIYRGAIVHFNSYGISILEQVTSWSGSTRFRGVVSPDGYGRKDNAPTATSIIRKHWNNYENMLYTELLEYLPRDLAFRTVLGYF